ncbi:MAG: TetR/AcrR family transcriptional regulator [Acidimicrobiales bacterium]
MGAVRRTTRRTTKGEVTRRVMLEAATTVFLRKGLFDARIADIAAEASMSKAAFYRHFSSKSEVLAEVMTQAKDQSMAALASRDGAESDGPLFVRLAHANRRYVAAYRDYADVIRLVEQQLAVDDAVRAVRRDWQPDFIRPLFDRLSRHQAGGRVAPEVDLGEAVPALTATVDNLSYVTFVLRGLDTMPDRLLDAIDRVWGTVLGLPWSRHDLATVRPEPAGAGVDPAPAARQSPGDDTAGPGPGPASPGVEATRVQLLGTARAVFEKVGYLDARVADITAGAGVAHGTFYNYFQSRFDIFAALTVNLVDDYLATIHAPPEHPSISTLGHDLRHAIAYYRDNLPFIVVAEQFATIDPDCAAVRLRVRATLTGRLRAVIVALQQAGRADVRLDAEATAEVLISMFDRSMFEWHVLGVPADVNAGEAYLPTVWRRALMPPTPPGGGADSTVSAGGGPPRRDRVNPAGSHPGC